MKIGLFGGAFDPFHNGHLAICKGAVRELKLDKLIIIPSGNAPHKHKFNASFEDRFNMAWLSVKKLGYVVSDYENRRRGVSYSANTVADFKTLYPNDELYFIIGEDSYRDFPKWYEPERIFEKATVAVYPRSEARANVTEPAIMFNTEKIDVSSTKLRNMIKNGEEISSLVPTETEQYIQKHKLYREVRI